jgi:hypothetical protein
MTTTTYINSGKAPTLEQLQKMVGGYIEVVSLSDGRQLIVNEEGLLHDLPKNPEATALNVAMGNGQPLIVGNAVVLGGTARIK